MPIAPLPDSTVRAIGSSLVLNDACSVVKELIDNALDATATSVTVEISPDTLDIIQVKDNGHGISVEGRQLVCKRGCTSKISAFEDLDKLGGSSLGFRGEALASVAELSEAVALITRVDGEVVGTTMKFSKDGSLQQ
jgi:DNA mismatch repair ATPase MutL